MVDQCDINTTNSIIPNPKNIGSSLMEISDISFYSNKDYSNGSGESSVNVSNNLFSTVDEEKSSINSHKYSKKILTRGDNSNFSKKRNNIIIHHISDNTNKIPQPQITDNFSQPTKVFQNKDQIIDNNNCLTIQDALLNDSRITPTGNGNSENRPYCTQPTNGQKWWAAVILGLLFALVSSSVAYSITSSISKPLGFNLVENLRPNFNGLLIHTLIFIVIVRIILW